LAICVTKLYYIYLYLCVHITSLNKKNLSKRRGAEGLPVATPGSYIKKEKTNTKKEGELKPKPSEKTNTSNDKIKRERTVNKQKEQHINLLF